MITQLTDTQRSQLLVYRDKWIAIGLSTEPMRFEAAREAAGAAYRATGQATPECYFRALSPVDGSYIGAALESVDDIRDWVGREDELRAMGRALPKKDHQRHFAAQIQGGHDLSWIAYCNYYKEVLDVAGLEVLDGLTDLAKVCGWWTPYENACVLQERPVHIRRNAQGRLHNLRGPAVLYPDGFSVFSINGVQVPSWMATKPAEHWTRQDFASLKNAEAARTFISLYGVERLLSPENTKVLGTHGTYELLELDLGTGVRRYLKMLNPSVEGVVHVEPVHPSCATVQAALDYRRYGTPDARESWTPSVQT